MDEGSTRFDQGQDRLDEGQGGFRVFILQRDDDVLISHVPGREFLNVSELEGESLGEDLTVHTVLNRDVRRTSGVVIDGVGREDGGWRGWGDDNVQSRVGSQWEAMDDAKEGGDHCDQVELHVAL